LKGKKPSDLYSHARFQTSFFFSVLFTRYFQNKYETEFFATLVTILALGLVFSTLCLLPVDIFLVSSTVDVTKGIKKSWATSQVIEAMTFTMSIVYYGKTRRNIIIVV
jgi:LMBR1 domain-containing protein 1